MTDSTAIPLSPMLVQYLVGLCCLRWDPDAVDVTIGDMVLDNAAKKERDVDVTVTVAEHGGTKHVFKAYEVKHEGSPLDVTDVEALCLKLLDMPSVSHRAIVSSSGFSSGAQAKANHHGIDLYAVRPWTRPLQEQFPLFQMRGTADECFPMTQLLLCWRGPQYSLVARSAKAGFRVEPDDQLFASDGNTHGRYSTFAAYTEELLLRSTEILCPIEPAAKNMLVFPVPFSVPDGVPAGPAWPHTHTLDVREDDVHVNTHRGIAKLDFVTITGFLRWERNPTRGHYYVMERVPTGEPFAAALIATNNLREGHMTCLVFSPKTREISIEFVRLAEKHRNAIRRLKLDLPPKVA